jgi:hypothetical protein
MARDLYQEVTDKIISALEAGTAPWVRPWQSAAGNGGMPYNVVSGKGYRGINVPLLFAPSYAASGWLTFKQALDVGANVRKGEKGSMIVFYKPFTVTDRNAAPGPNGERKEKTIPLLRAFHVFNVAQVENLPAKYLPAPDTRTEPERIAAADKLMARAEVRHGGDRAFYAPGPDFINLPDARDFRTWRTITRQLARTHAWDRPRIEISPSIRETVWRRSLRARGVGSGDGRRLLVRPCRHRWCFAASAVHRELAASAEKRQTRGPDGSKRGAESSGLPASPGRDRRRGG